MVFCLNLFVLCLAAHYIRKDVFLIYLIFTNYLNIYRRWDAIVKSIKACLQSSVCSSSWYYLQYCETELETKMACKKNFIVALLLLLSIGVCFALPVIDEQVDRSLRKHWKKETGVNNKRASKFFDLLERFFQSQETTRRKEVSSTLSCKFV